MPRFDCLVLHPGIKKGICPIWLHSILVAWIFIGPTLFIMEGAHGNPVHQNDSLFNRLLATTDPAIRVDLLLNLAEHHNRSSADSCRYYLNKAESLFAGINSLPYLGRYYEMKGDLNQEANDFPMAMSHYKIAVFCYDKTGEKFRQMRLLNAIGSGYAQSGNNAESFKHYLKAKEIAIETGDNEMLAKIYNNLGRLICKSDNYIAGIDYYKKALAVFEAANDSFKVATVAMNMGTAYFHREKLDSSRIYTKEAISIFRAINKKYYLGSSLQTYAFTLISEKKYGEALNYLEQVHEIALETGSGRELIESKFLLSDVLVFTGVTYCMKGDYQLAKKYLLPGYRLSDSLGMVERTNDAVEYLSLAYESLGKTDSAFYFHKLFKRTSDTLMKNQSINIVKLAEAQMDFEEKVREKKTQLAYNKVLQKRNLLIFIGAFTILLTLVLLLILKLRIEKQKKVQAEIEKKKAELEKQTVDLKLESQQKELTLNVMNLIRKNEMILDLSNRLIQIKESMTDSQAGSDLVKLVNAMQKSADDNVWEEFELRFKQVHSNFYERLISQFPDLTPSELKLCALLKLNLTNKEISELSGQRQATLEVARYRLRKKLRISNSQVNLVTFLSQI